MKSASTTFIANIVRYDRLLNKILELSATLTRCFFHFDQLTFADRIYFLNKDTEFNYKYIIESFRVTCIMTGNPSQPILLSAMKPHPGSSKLDRFQVLPSLILRFLAFVLSTWVLATKIKMPFALQGLKCYERQGLDAYSIGM